MRKAKRKHCKHFIKAIEKALFNSRNADNALTITISLDDAEDIKQLLIRT